jgi:hypothetical protein
MLLILGSREIKYLDEVCKLSGSFKIWKQKAVFKLVLLPMYLTASPKGVVYMTNCLISPLLLIKDIGNAQLTLFLI